MRRRALEAMPRACRLVSPRRVPPSERTRGPGARRQREGTRSRAGRREAGRRSSPRSRRLPGGIVRAGSARSSDLRRNAGLSHDDVCSAARGARQRRASAGPRVKSVIAGVSNSEPISANGKTLYGMEAALLAKNVNLCASWANSQFAVDDFERGRVSSESVGSCQGREGAMVEQTYEGLGRGEHVSSRGRTAPRGT